MTVPTEEDARELLVMSCQTDRISGEFLARELLEDQNLDNLEEFGQRLGRNWNFILGKRAERARSA